MNMQESRIKQTLLRDWRLEYGHFFYSCGNFFAVQFSLYNMRTMYNKVPLEEITFETTLLKSVSENSWKNT